MENENKYRRWAWGALIGLVAVIIIAGIVMAMSLSSPEPTKEVAKTVNTVEEPKNEETTQEPAKDENTTENDTKTEAEPQTTTQDTESTPSAESSNAGSVATTESNIPKTGPEDTILPIVALAICSSLFAYNVVLFKKNA